MNLANVFIALVAILHFYFLILEMFLWTTPKGMKIFGNSEEKAKMSKVLAANQGLYNGFLSAGLVYGLYMGATEIGFHFKAFFLSCVIVAGLYGAYTVGRKILFVQAVPALIALVLLVLSNRS